MDFISKHFTPTALIKVVITIALCLIAMKVLKHLIKRYFKKNTTHQSLIIFNKAINFVGFTTMSIVIISQLGFNSLFTTALGTAGIAGVAIGFASKTSLENIISGVLLLSDKSFKIDDMIVVDNVEGIVESIDSLSVKIRTYDNQIVRVPNVKVLNSNVANLYPTNERRKDFYFKVAYNSDVSKIENLLKEIAQRNPYAIRKDETFIYFSSFEQIGFKIKYGIWFEKGKLTPLVNSITKDISETFKKEGIQIPVPLLNSEQQ